MDMSFKEIDGIAFERMLRAGYKTILSHEKEVNDMNVFPVPDGDTGSNIRMTLQNGIEKSSSCENLGLYLKEIKKGILLGARGNSGVIFSQLFTGIADYLEPYDSIGPAQLVQAFVEAYRTAYESVINPVEGTILTVAREGAEKISDEINGLSTVAEVLESYISEMKKSLLRTPELLPVLKESGVLDSGATGYIYVVEGMLMGLRNEDTGNESLPETGMLNSLPVCDTSSFNRYSKFEDGYCTEFILQLMEDGRHEQNFDLNSFIEKLKGLGESIVAFMVDDRVKVHIHTLKPYLVIELAQRYGEFVTFKMDNMQIQHNEHDSIVQKKNPVHKKIAMVAVVNGEGLKDLYSSFGCDVIIDGGATMNASSQEFVEALDQLDADRIIILPNNKNIFFAAKQAVEISGAKNVEILESQNPVEGYYALAMGQVDSDYGDPVELMKKGIEESEVLSVTVASKDYSQNDVKCSKGDFIALLKGDLVSSGKVLEEVVSSAIKCVPDYDSKELCMVVTGQDATDDMTENLLATVEECLPDIEINTVEGGQKIFYYMIGF